MRPGPINIYYFITPLQGIYDHLPGYAPLCLVRLKSSVPNIHHLTAGILGLIDSIWNDQLLSGPNDFRGGNIQMVESTNCIAMENAVNEQYSHEVLDRILLLPSHCRDTPRK